MIADTFPQLHSLTLNQKFELAAELWDEVLLREAELEEPQGLSTLLEQRLADYRAGKIQGRFWEEVRQSTLAERA